MNVTASTSALSLKNKVTREEWQTRVDLAACYRLVAHYGWEDLAVRIRIRCFDSDPSIPSSLKFLRKTPWAREKVESLYLFMLRERARAARADG